jgi:hypothetical protein
LTVAPRAVDPHCFDADPDPAQNLDADPDSDQAGGGGGRSAKNVHPPWQNPRYAPASGFCFCLYSDSKTSDSLFKVTIPVHRIHGSQTSIH